MIYLYGYLGIGVVVLAVIYGAHRLTKEKESKSIHDLLEAVDPDREKLSYRILNNYIAPVLAAILVVVVWPVAVYMQSKGLSQKEESSGLPEEREFAVEREHLLERLTVQEIEGREAVTDPLGAAPELPFGHFNSAWREFLKGHADGAELWSFSAHWQARWGRKELRYGYVVVQDGAPGAHFLTGCKDIPGEVKGGGGGKQKHANDTPITRQAAF